MYSGKGVGESSPSLSNVTDLIRMKEKELHHFHNLRTNQLESIIDEQQKMINEANKRFNLLKEDFQYNLTLIEARDAEIVRLEKELKARKAEEDEYERKIRTLNNKIETMQQKEREKQEKNEQEKQAGKVSLQYEFYQFGRDFFLHLIALTGRASCHNRNNTLDCKRRNQK